MVWLGLESDTFQMTVSIPQVKLQVALQLVDERGNKTLANLHQLCVLLSKLFHMAQWCQPNKLFLNRMLATLRQCPVAGEVTLDEKFKNDINWFCKYLSGTNGMFIIEQDASQVISTHLRQCLHDSL